MKDGFFEASSIFVGLCKNPSCRGVHIQLLDAFGEIRAHAVMPCEEIDQLAENLRTVRDSIPERQYSRETH